MMGDSGAPTNSGFGVAPHASRASAPAWVNHVMDATLRGRSRFGGGMAGGGGPHGAGAAAVAGSHMYGLRHLSRMVPVKQQHQQQQGPPLPDTPCTDVPNSAPAPADAAEATDGAQLTHGFAASALVHDACSEYRVWAKRVRKSLRRQMQPALPAQQGGCTRCGVRHTWPHAMIADLDVWTLLSELREQYHPYGLLDTATARTLFQEVILPHVHLEGGGHFTQGGGAGSAPGQGGNSHPPHHHHHAHHAGPSRGLAAGREQPHGSRPRGYAWRGGHGVRHASDYSGNRSGGYRHGAAAAAGYDGRPSYGEYHARGGSSSDHSREGGAGAFVPNMHAIQEAAQE